MRSQCLAACTSAACTRSSARWWSPVRRYAVRARAGPRAWTNSSNPDRSVIRTPFTVGDARMRRGGGQPKETISAGAAGEALEVHDHHGAGLEAQPAARGEVGERLVDRLAGGADQLGELLLGEVVVDVDSVVGGAAEAVGEVEQRLGDAAGHVGEDEVGDDVVGLAQPRGELGQQAAGDDRTALEPAQQVLV